MPFSFSTDRRDLNYPRYQIRRCMIKQLKNKATDIGLKLDYRAISNSEILTIHNILIIEDLGLMTRRLLMFALIKLLNEEFSQPVLSILDYAMSSYDIDEIDGRS